MVGGDGCIQCQCTYCHRTIHFKMVKMVTFMLCLYCCLKKKKQMLDAETRIQALALLLTPGCGGSWPSSSLSVSVSLWKRDRDCTLPTVAMWGPLRSDLSINLGAQCLPGTLGVLRKCGYYGSYGFYYLLLIEVAQMLLWTVFSPSDTPMAAFGAPA